MLDEIRFEVKVAGIRIGVKITNDIDYSIRKKEK